MYSLPALLTYSSGPQVPQDLPCADAGAECAEEPGGILHLPAGAGQLPHERMTTLRTHGPRVLDTIFGTGADDLLASLVVRRRTRMIQAH